jgi:hypothetical protein
MVAPGGIVDMAGPVALPVPVENDPRRTAAVHCGCSDAGFSPFKVPI